MDQKIVKKLESDIEEAIAEVIMKMGLKRLPLLPSPSDPRDSSKWVTADYAAKRRILEIVCLNCSLDDVDLCATMRKPFDLLAKGLVSKDSRGDWIRTSDLLTPSQTVLRYFTEFGGCLCFGSTVVLLFEATWFTFFPGQIATLIFDFGTRKITSPSGVLASLGGVAALGALKRRELRRPCEVLSCHFATGVQKGPPKLFIVRDSRS